MSLVPTLRLLLLLCGMLLLTGMACAQQVALTLDAIEHPAFSARQIGLRLDVATGAAELDIGRLTLGTRQIGRVRLRCGEFTLSAEKISCRRGELRPVQAAPLPLEFTYRPATRQLELDVREGDLASSAALAPELVAYHPAGRFDAHLNLAAMRAELKLQLRNATFADAEGKRAGDKIEANISILATTLHQQVGGWSWQATLDWQRGELYLAPLYRAGGLRLTAAGQAAAALFSVDSATLTLDGIGTLNGTLRWQSGTGNLPGRLLAAELSSGTLDLATLVPQFVQPFLDAEAGAKLTASGLGRISAGFDADGISRLEIDLDEAAIAANSAELHGIHARIPWRRETEAPTQAEFRAAGGKFATLPLGAFSLPLSMHGLEFSLPRAEIPLFDGKLLFEDFHAMRVGGAWQWRLAGALEPVSMPLLSQTLGWPKMSGLLGAVIPKISYADATLALDGQLMVSLFDGYLAADGLKVVEPFGALPRVQANIVARHLDLGMLTETFSFGDITGYIDADIAGLEMSGMRPLAFDARILSAPGDYRKRISQRAVQNISSLGGAGAGAAIQRSFLRFFDTFGYDSIGMSCRLVNEICLMGGIEAASGGLSGVVDKLGLPGSAKAAEAAHGYLLIKGGGVPSLNVIGYNRRVHWEELVSRVKDAIAGNGKIEVR